MNNTTLHVQDGGGSGFALLPLSFGLATTLLGDWLQGLVGLWNPLKNISL